MLKPVMARYRSKVSRIYFRQDAAFANPDIYEFLETAQTNYAIRLPAMSAGRAWKCSSFSGNHSS